MTGRIGRLGNLARVTSRSRWESVSRGPIWHCFYSNTDIRRAHEISRSPRPPSPNIGPSRRILALVVTVFAGLAGYGISKVPSSDTNTPKIITNILDPERIPTGKYATLEDMKKVT